MDRNGFSDPYVKLTLCGKTHKSKTIKKNLNPRWDEGFEYKGVLKDLVAEPMQLHAFDYDFGSRDDKLGNASVDLRALQHERQKDIDVALSDNGGNVYLRVTWNPVGGGGAGRVDAGAVGALVGRALGALVVERASDTDSAGLGTLHLHLTPHAGSAAAAAAGGGASGAPDG